MEQASPASTLTVTMTNCARCGGDHGQLVAREMARPFAPEEAGGMTWTHWAPCPTNGDPILVMVTRADLGELTDQRLDQRNGASLSGL